MSYLKLPEGCTLRRDPSLTAVEAAHAGGERCRERREGSSVGDGYKICLLLFVDDNMCLIKSVSWVDMHKDRCMMMSYIYIYICIRIGDQIDRWRDR